MSRFLAFLFLASSILLLTTVAEATSRYSAKKLGCNQIKSIIRNEGAAIFRYPSPRKPGLTLYDRYVANGQFCASHQTTEKVYIPSADGDQCLVQRCRSRPDDCEGRLETCF